MSEPQSPWPVVEEWLPGNDEPERPQMNLSTVSITGEPDARTVLLSEYDSEGFYFHTDALSRKAAAIVANPAVALTFLWPGFTKQLVVQGRAEVAPAHEIAAAYRARSPFLQQLAWQNTFEFAQLPDDERRDRWASFTEEHSDGASEPTFSQPETWIGFLVRPTRMTFWSSGSDAPSRRVEYRATSGGWTVAYLPG
ncbi:N/A [soil metagenome]